MAPKIKIPGILLTMLVSVIALSCTGVKRDYHENGSLRSEIQTRGGRYHGLATWYYADGMRQHECFFERDTLQGKSTRWYHNGKIHSVEFFKNNQLHGKSLKYDMNGKLISEENFVMGVPHGAFIQYYTNGQAQIEGTYHNGFYDNKWFYYEDDGTLVGIGEFKMGSGKQRAWYTNGTLKREVHYLDNEKHGEEKWYYPDGSLSKVLTYDNGRLLKTQEFD